MTLFPIISIFDLFVPIDLTRKGIISWVPSPESVPLAANQMKSEMAEGAPEEVSYRPASPPDASCVACLRPPAMACRPDS